MGYQAAVIAISSLAIITLIPPLVWHAKAFNISAIVLVCWLLIMDIKIFIDAIIWGGDNFNTTYDGRGYCDVMVKLQVGANVGVLTSLAGIMINLYKILKANRPLPGNRSKEKIIMDLLINFTTPVLVMALNYLVQTARYSIFKYAGCQVSSSLSWVTIITYTLWLLIWSVINVILAILIIYTFFKKRKDVNDILKCTNSGLTLTRFAKLLIFCCIIILVMFPLSFYISLSDIGNVGPYNYKKIHNKILWNLILYYKANSPYFLVWIYLGMSFAAFIFFGLGSDATELYLSILPYIGLGKVVQYFKDRKLKKKLIKADKLVNSVLIARNENGLSNSTPGSYNISEDITGFDVEMQKLQDEDDEDDNYNDKDNNHGIDGLNVESLSPITNKTPISDIFKDKYAISKDLDYYNYLKVLDDDLLEDLNEEELEYLNMLNDSNVSPIDNQPRFSRSSRRKSELLLDDFDNESTQIKGGGEDENKVNNERQSSPEVDLKYNYTFTLQQK
ncbi:hypothetical protein WICMUC_001097 [Wickerhamomyces mucosus]|uniref:Pheromone a factor receptor n=1 Tax=Wickerhamomyces mucosus TaxID=1378264 RepID=A0A9P8PVN0_9ASCO|nr:hypothetical protein WICMUC_001097 [Wickerhamomyces mucosus]